jgi:hypothetical protein
MFNNVKNKFNRKYTVFEILAFGDSYIELLEMFSCNNRNELHQREGYYIRSLNCVNKVVPCRTKKQYRIDNKDKISERKKQYRIDNKDKISERKKQYYIDNKDKISERRKQRLKRSPTLFINESKANMSYMQ